MENEKDSCAKTAPTELSLVGPEMACLHIVQPAVKVAGGPECQKLAARLFKAVDFHKGWGLAAPQLGVLADMAVVTIPGTGVRFCMVNPVIKKLSGSMQVAVEACLSLPGVQVHKMRREYVEVVFQDENGKFHTIGTGGILSRVIQHEIQHLRGLLITDGAVKAAPMRAMDDEQEPAAQPDSGNDNKRVGAEREAPVEPSITPGIPANPGE